MSVTDGPGADLGPQPDSADRVDAYLSRKAQQKLDPSAVVYERSDGWWYLAIPGKPLLNIGKSFGRAKESLLVLAAAEIERNQSQG
jgi:hypothetical protein